MKQLLPDENIPDTGRNFTSSDFARLVRELNLDIHEPPYRKDHRVYIERMFLEWNRRLRGKLPGQLK